MIAVGQVAQLEATAHRIREHILAMGASPDGAHVGGALSIADLLTVLYFHVLRVRPEETDWIGRDYFILSKGHAGCALYAALAERGFMKVEELATFARAGSRLAGHPLRKVPGVEFPTGSLGHGLSLGVGLALAARRDGRSNRTFVLLGDGELQEGAVWEASMSASHFKLDNLVAIVDRNNLQISGQTEQRMALEPLAERWRAFGWEVVEVDGHHIPDLLTAFGKVPFAAERPSLLIARTNKGRGVRFMQGRKKSHFVTLNPDLYRKALTELRSTRGD